jgi:hypothetical protein
MNSFNSETRPLLYLYDLPKNLVTSVKIASIIKQKCGYELTEPAQFRDKKPSLINEQSPLYMTGIIKIDPNELQNVARAMKYFDIEDGTNENG